MSVPVLAVDGPSGVGKGTICQRVASTTGWHLLDSGSLYRVTALKSLQNDSKNTSQLIDIASNIDVIYTAGEGGVCTMLDGVDVTDDIRTEAVGNAASSIAVIPELRQALLDRQRAFARSPGLVADGRDMGTVVFPEADLKIYLTATAEERAKRRYKQLIDKGIDANLPDLIDELRERDDRDMNRDVAPLVAAEDAITIDTTEMNIDEVSAEVMRLLRDRFALED